MRSAKLNRRYHLHRKLKKEKIGFSAICKTVYVPVNQEIENADVLELQQNYNYSVQLIIPDE